VRFSPVARATRELPEESAMASGTVKWFNPQKGYGFIQPSDGGRDVFVHISAVQQAGLTTLVEGQKVSYDVITTDRGRTAAGNLKAS
jgi:CspA family cold shock protein